MKAAVITKKDEISIEDVECPEIECDTILIKNYVAGVNFADILQLRGLYPYKPTAGIPGIESAGKVVKVGSKVTDYKVGDRVLSLSGDAFAEYTLVPDYKTRVSKLPRKVSYETAAAIGLQGITALSMVTQAYKVQSGDFVLVHAAAGGVGINLIQIIHFQGGIVIATTSTEDKMKLCKLVGADYVINYKKEDIVERVMEITEGRGVQAALDSVGKATFEASLESLAPFGLLISFGQSSGPIPPLNVDRLILKSISVKGHAVWCYMSTAKDAKHWFNLLLEMVSNEIIQPKIKKIYEFSDIREAFDDLANGSTTGKLLLKIAPS
ncbi:quinone oxidoreductase [Pilobolus umbonatus]|nr:quinone oxidoreductase [Pilobolus umbonatus]